MAKSLDVPWDTIRQEYVSGMSYAALEHKYGVKENTIQQRAKRHGWRTATAIAKTRAKQAADHVIKSYVSTALASAKPELDSAISEWVKNSKQAAKLLVGKVSEIVPHTSNPEDLQKLAGTLERADTVGRRSLGMDTAAGIMGGVNLAVVGLLVVGKDDQPASDGLLMDYESESHSVDVDCQPVAESAT